MLRHISLISLICILTLCSFAQPAQPPTGKKLSPELEKKALSLLDEAINDIATLRLEENQISLYLQAGDILWERDEKRARGLFQQAITIFTQNAERQQMQTSSPDDEYRGRRNSLSSQRREIVLKLAERDVQMAWSLFISSQALMDKNSENEKQKGRVSYEEKELEKWLLAKIAEADPKFTLQKAQEALAKDELVDLTSAVESLAQKDKTAAVQLTRDIVKRLKAAKADDAQVVFSIATNLLKFVVDKTFSPFIYMGRQSGSAKDKLALEKEDKQNIFELVGDSALKILSAPGDSARGNQLQFLLFMKSLGQEFAEFAPRQVRQLNAKATELRQNQREEERQILERFEQQFEQRQQPATSRYEKLKQNPAATERDYLELSYAAMNEGNSELARQIITEKIKDSGLQENFRAELERRELTTATDKGEIEQARKAIEKLSNPMQKIDALIPLIQKALEQKKKNMADQLIGYTQGILKNQFTKRYELDGQLKLAAMYAQTAPLRGFEILEVAVPRVNQLISAFITINEFDPNGDMIKDDEVLYSMTGIYSGSTISYIRSFDEALSELAWSDFARATALIGSLERSDLRLMSKIIVVENLLKKQDEVKK